MLGLPSRPQSANVTKVLPTIVELNIQQPEEDGGMPITHYVVGYDNESVEFVFGMCVLNSIIMSVLLRCSMLVT